ncbi:MAG TPA: ubiquinol-cytochrome c reductase iron-sulfur subunit [bacterium]
MQVSPAPGQPIDESISRRGFLKVAIAVLNGLIALVLAVPGLGFLLTPVFRKASSSWIDLGAVDGFSANQPRKATFKYISEAGYTRSEKTGFVWVVPDPDGENQVTVLSAVCSHTGCNVAWQPDEEKFVCPCHEGRYTLRGEVVSGPPPRPLTKLPTRLENGKMFIQLPT